MDNLPTELKLQIFHESSASSLEGILALNSLTRSFNVIYRANEHRILLRFAHDFSHEPSREPFLVLLQLPKMNRCKDPKENEECDCERVCVWKEEQELYDWADSVFEEYEMDMDMIKTETLKALIRLARAVRFANATNNADDQFFDGKNSLETCEILNRGYFTCNHGRVDPEVHQNYCDVMEGMAARFIYDHHFIRSSIARAGLRENEDIWEREWSDHYYTGFERGDGASLYNPEGIIYYASRRLPPEFHYTMPSTPLQIEAEEFFELVAASDEENFEISLQWQSRKCARFVEVDLDLE